MSAEKTSMKFLEKKSRKLAFSKFVNSKADIDHQEDDGKQTWKCCDRTFTCHKDIHHHAAIHHEEEISQSAKLILTEGSEDARWPALKKQNNCVSISDEDETGEMLLPCGFSHEEKFSYLPCNDDIAPDDSLSEEGQVLLFYKYRNIKNTEHVRLWQEELCRRLNLAGKIRIGKEGINVTVAGSKKATDTYVDCFTKHPLFSNMTEWDFKKSAGNSKVFPDGLKVGVYQEIVPMGIPPEEVSYVNTGTHLSVDEFHRAMTEYLENDEDRDKKLLVDCRNFYESKIGQFEGAVCPDIRKFSYWPEFISKNRKLFENKEIYMYCTGGIRCERGSAYLLDQGICDKVYQLHGGIHKYIEKYPDGYFRGKLFVFDDRYHIQANDDVVAACRYCEQPWDQYQPCSSKHCHQLVLSCTTCRDKGHTACCPACQMDSKDKRRPQEQCECTRKRPRIPVKSTQQSSSETDR